MLLSFLYVLLAAAIIVFELSRKKRMLLDQLSVATGFYLADIVIPAILLHLILDTGLVNVDSIDSLQLLYRYYRLVQPVDKWIAFLGTMVAYLGLVIGYKYFEGRGLPKQKLTIRTEFPLRLVWIILFLVFCGLALVYGNSLMPGNPLEGLLLSTYFRAEDPFYAFERTAVNANIYSCFHAFLLVSVLGFALYDENRKGRIVYLVSTFLFIVFDAVASGARRNLLIAALIIYTYVANRSGKYKMQYLLPLFLIAVPLLNYGKEFLRNLTDLDISSFVDTDVTYPRQALTTAYEAGLSHVESLGTLVFYNGPPRFGVDHLFSALRMIPLGLFGFEKPWPERIVRISTAYLSGDPTTQDIPPGYIGQCWIDFPYIGFFLIPVLHGAVFAFVDRRFDSIDLPKSPFYLMVYLIVGYVVAMPLVNGSLDFVFSIDLFYAVILVSMLHFTNSKARAWNIN